MSFGYAMEKLSSAVRTMAVSRGSLQDRLVSAYSALHPIRPEDDLPTEDMRLRYDTIVRGLTSAHGPKGTLLATAAELNDNDATTLATSILDLLDELTVYRMDHPAGSP